MDHKTKVANMKVVQAGVKTKIVDEDLDMLYYPMFYNKEHAHNILQKLTTELVDQDPASTSFKSLTLSSNSNTSSGPHFVNRKEEIRETVCKKTTNNGPSSPTLLEIRDDIEKNLGITLNLSYVDWDNDGSGIRGGCMINELNIEAGSSIIYMSFGAPRDLLLRYHASKKLNTLSASEKPKFSRYKLNFESGSLV
jgi:hypothetical protein